LSPGILESPVPSKPARSCKYPRCPNYSSDGTGYCTDHVHLYIPFVRGDDSRPSIYARAGYGAEWKQARARQLAAYPSCRYCGRPATDVHHLVPVKRGGTHDSANLISLCGSCHNLVEPRGTAARGGRVKSSGAPRITRMGVPSAHTDENQVRGQP
jgi:5-methylcytosine-specific restriction protein A